MKSVALFLAIAYPVFSQGVAYTFNSSGLLTLSHNGQSYAGAFMGMLVNSATFDSTLVSYTTNAKTVQSDGFTINYNAGIAGDTTYVATLSGTGTDVFNFRTCVTNNDTLARPITAITVDRMFQITFPSAETWTGDAGTVVIGWSAVSAVEMATWATGQMAVYASSYEDDLGFFYLTADDKIRFSLTSVAPLDNTIASGETKCTTLHLKWGSTSETISTLGVVGYNAWRAQHPEQLSYPNRNPFAFMTIGDAVKTATNPRGWQTTGVVSPDFLGAGFSAARTGLLNRISSQLANVALMSPRVQTVMLWDIEGQEFPHSMTYIGGAGNNVDLSLYSVIAPEMETTTNGIPLIDSVISTVRNAGFDVGVTLRPATFAYGSGAPAVKCYARNTGNGQSYIRTDVSYPDRMYACASVVSAFDDSSDSVSCSASGAGLCSQYYNGSVVSFYQGSGATLPAGIVNGDSYYICNANTGAFTFQVGTDSGCGSLVTDFSGATGTNRAEFWRGPTNSQGQQAIAGTYDLALDILRSKVDYYRSRWGIKAFYVDTSGYCLSYPLCPTAVSMTPQHWYTLNSEYPSVLFLPESSVANGASARFTSFNNSEYGVSATTRRLWPDAFVVPYTHSNATRYLANRTYIREQIQQGVPYMIESGAATLDKTYITEDYQLAATVNGVIAMTNSATGSSRVFQGSPGTSFAYQLTMRVYFADTANNLAASTTYCTRRATDLCYLGGVLKSTASLDLSTTPYWQLRYYDFAGNLVSNPGNYGTIQ